MLDFNALIARNSVICISTAKTILRDESDYLAGFFVEAIKSAALRQKCAGNKSTPSLYVFGDIHYPTDHINEDAQLVNIYK